MTYQPGQRVELVHTNDPYTRLRPGARGTVTGYLPDLHTVHITWDDGSTLAMLQDAGDRIRVLDELPAPERRPDMPDTGQRRLLASPAVSGPQPAAAARWRRAAIAGQACGAGRATAGPIVTWGCRFPGCAWPKPPAGRRTYVR